MSAAPHLETLFEKINQLHFDGFLDAPILKWNARLRTSAGRFVPQGRACPPVIEVASYLLSEPEPHLLVEDTLAHEMIHYWLWVRKQPYGHTPEFHSKMRLMGVSRYNPVPRDRPYKHVYRCRACGKRFPARRKLGALACADCCARHSGGRYDRRFLLELCLPAGGAAQEPPQAAEAAPGLR